MNFDFVLLRNDHADKIHTASLIRRYLAAWFDTFCIAICFISFSIYEDPNGTWTNKPDAPDPNLLFILLIILLAYLPELFFRQTLGMFLFDLIVIVPPKENPKWVLFKRKLMNILEFCLPSPVYYYSVAFCKDNRSLSDQVSHCIIARKKHLLKGKLKKDNNTFYKILIPTLFTFSLLVMILVLWIFLSAIFHLDKLSF